MRDDGLILTGSDSKCSSRDIVDWPECDRDGFVFTEVNAVVNDFRYRNAIELAQIAAVLDE